MVKRTLVVLGILSMCLMVTGTSFAGGGLDLFGAPGCWEWPGNGACGADRLYVPVDCPPYPKSATIIKKWSCKIEGPCPAPAPAACGTGGCGKDARPTLVGGLAGAFAFPCEMLFGGFDGVYGCTPTLGWFKQGPCGPGYGPLPGVVAAVPMALAAPTTIFGFLW